MMQNKNLLMKHRELYHLAVAKANIEKETTKE